MNDKIEWVMEKVLVRMIRDNPKNPRKIEKQQQQKLQTLIEKFGMIDKPILNRDFSIIGGHQRVKILRKLKRTHVECWVPQRQLSEKEVDELCIGLNLNQGTWDYDILATFWDIEELITSGFKEELLLEVVDKKPQEKQKKSVFCPSCGFEMKD